MTLKELSDLDIKDIGIYEDVMNAWAATAYLLLRQNTPFAMKMRRSLVIQTVSELLKMLQEDKMILIYDRNSPFPTDITPGSELIEVHRRIDIMDSAWRKEWD